MLKTNKLRFFKILGKASKPLKTLKKVKKHHGDCNEMSYLLSRDSYLPLRVNQRNTQSTTGLSLIRRTSSSRSCLAMPNCQDVRFSNGITRFSDCAANGCQMVCRGNTRKCWLTLEKSKTLKGFSGCATSAASGTRRWHLKSKSPARTTATTFTRLAM